MRIPTLGNERRMSEGRCCSFPPGLRLWEGEPDVCGAQISARQTQPLTLRETAAGLCVGEDEL
ncbi:MAG: hypothetical protein LIO75_04145 [Lachnospiraceae bacterium]|nr:hypothetical protein [Lachnospiraceae bacterium]